MSCFRDIYHERVRVRGQAVQRQEVRVHLQQLRQQQREPLEEDQAQGAVACIQCGPVDPKEAAFVNDDVDTMTRSSTNGWNHVVG